LTLFLASGATLSLITSLPPNFYWVRIAFSALAAAVSLYSIVMQNQKLAVDASDLHASWNRLSMEYTRLWENVYTDDALDKLNALDDRAAELSKARASFPNRKGAMLRWQLHVEQQHGIHA